MTRRPALLRWIASAQLGLLASAWVLPMATGGSCPHGTASAGAGMPAGHHHAASGGRTPAPQPASTQCQCLGHCCGSRAPLVPAAIRAPLALESRIPATTVAARPAEPPPAPHLDLLPFSTAPPAA